MKNTYVTDNVMFSIILLAFFSLDTDIKAGRCCNSRRINKDTKSLKTKVIDDKEIIKGQDDFNKISTENFYKILCKEYFSNINNDKHEEKFKYVKENIKKIKKLIIDNLKAILTFTEKSIGNEIKKNELFAITINESGEYIDNQINEFCKKKGYKDHFLLLYILFKINKNILKLKDDKNTNTLNDIVESFDFNSIIKDNEKKETIDIIQYANNSEQIDFNDRDLIDYSLKIINKVRYCFLVYLILITNEFFDKFPFLAEKVRVQTSGCEVFDKLNKDKVTLSYLLGEMLKSDQKNLEVYIKMAKTKFSIVKKFYEMLNKISFIIFTDSQRFILKKNNNENTADIKDSCTNYNNLYNYSKGNKNELQSYLKQIFECKIQHGKKEKISVYNILAKYDEKKENFHNNYIPFDFKNLFSKIKITELSDAYKKLQEEKKEDNKNKNNN